MKKKIISVFAAFCLMLTTLYLPSDLFDISMKAGSAAAAQNCTGNHSGMTAWTRTDALPQSGKYYLKDNVNLTKETNLNGDLELCLNGKTITQGTPKKRIFAVGSNTLTLYDCGSGKITGANSGDVWTESNPIYVNGGTFNMYGGSITDNKSEGYGGGVRIESGGTFNMYGGSITGNKAKQGGGVSVSDSTFNMHGGSITNNVMTGSQGGGVYVSNGSFYMDGGTISNNEAYDGNNQGCGRGGGVYLTASYSTKCEFNFVNGTISENYSYGGGGGICFDNKATGTMSGGSITNNKTYYSGSGVYLNSNSSFTMSNGMISNNTAEEGAGGGIEASHSTFEMQGGTISGNTAYNGAGVKVSGPFLMTGGEIIDNIITAEYGGGLHIDSDSKYEAKIDGNVKISGNKTTSGVSHNVRISRGSVLTLGEKFDTDLSIGIFCSNTPKDCTDPITLTSVVSDDVFKNKFHSEHKDSDGVLFVHADDGTIRIEKPHTYKTTYDKDASDHWYECSVCQAEKDKAAHTWNTPSVTKAATCTETGKQTKSCSKCSYTTTETIPAKGHKLTHTARKEATCTAAGNIEYWYCTVCKTYFTNSACTTTTTQAKTVIAKKAHTQVTIPAVAATCTATGLTAGKKCSVCGVVTQAQTVTAIIPHTWSGDYSHNSDQHWQVCTVCGTENTRSGHSWNSGAVTTPATEYADGEKLYTCTDCGQTKTEVIPKLPHTHKWNSEWSSDENYHWHVCTECDAHDSDTAHNWGTGTVTKEPSCTETGTRTFTCSDCGKTKTETEPTAAHTEEVIPAVDPTCTETGLKAGKKCSVCGTILTAQATVDALGHDWNAGTVTTAPACTDTGVKTFTCKRSGCGAEKTEEIPANGHTEETIPAVAATCTETGLTEGKRCTVCNTVTVEQTTVAALGHDWNAGTVTKEPTCTETGSEKFTCKRCSEEKTEELPEKGHTEEAIPAVPATCTDTGLAEGKRCTVCNTVTVEQATVAALGHDWNAGTVTTAPTCTDKGVKTVGCDRCGAEKTEEIPANGHTEETIAAVAATCTTTGLTEGKKCSVCGEVLLAQEEAAALGHRWDDGEIVIPPTENTPGTKKFTCTVCGETKTEQIPMGKITTESSSGEGAPATELKTSPEELIEAALSPEEKDIIKDGTNINIILKVDDAGETVPEQDKQEVETQVSALSDCKLGQYLDVKLLKKIGNIETPITQTAKLIKVTFEIPANLRGKTEYSVIRVHNGVTTVLKDQDTDRNTVTIETDQFSTYALVYVEKTSQPSSGGRPSSGGSRPSGGGSYRPSKDDPVTSTPSDSGSSSSDTSAPSDSDSASSDTSTPSDSDSSSSDTSTPSDSGSSSSDTSTPSDSGSSSSDTGTPSESNNYDPETSESKPSDDTENPATGLAVSIIPLALAVVGLTAAVKRKRK